MRTVQPSIMIGAYGWDQDRVPRDEFDIRLAALHRLMDAKGWKAAFIYGDAAEHSALAWFSNFTPRLRWGMALFPRQGEPRLLAAVTPRDLPATRLTTWVPDVQSGSDFARAFDPWFAQMRPEGSVDISTVGFDLMRPPLYRSLQKSLGNRGRLHDADGDVATIRTLRPRELSLIREAARVTQAATQAFVDAWQDRRSVEAAALAAERSARLMAAQDVRTLVSHDGGRTLVPLRGSFEAADGPLVGYVAVKHMGYWADAFVSAGAEALRQRTQAALDAAFRSAVPGAPARALHAAALAKLAPHSLHPVLGGSIGHRIGWSPDEGGVLTGDAAHTLAPGDVYTVQVGAHDPAAGGALTSAMIAVTARGSELLCASPGSSHP
jgi:Xaa-Pro aminopeptidase